MKPRYLRPRLLEPDDAVDDFVCDSDEQTTWLRHHARQASATDTAKVFVVTTTDSPAVVAYYAWAIASITIDDAPARLRKGAGRCPQPVALLARLGVHQNHQRRGLGAALVLDVIARTAELGTHVGCRGLLVHAESDTARDFYLHLISEFESSPTDAHHLVLLMKDIHHTLRTLRP